MNLAIKQDEVYIYPCSQFNLCPPESGCFRCFSNIIDERGFVLMMTPKVATQSILNAYDASLTDVHGWCWDKNHSEELKDSHYIVGFIRNPFDRLVSCYEWMVIQHYHRTFAAYGIENNCSFEDFVNVIVNVPHHLADKHWRSCSYDMVSDDGIIPHQLVRYENLHDDFVKMCEEIKERTGAVFGGLNRLNASVRKPTKEYYTDDLIEKVAEYYKDDLANFNYEPNW